MKWVLYLPAYRRRLPYLMSLRFDALSGFKERRQRTTASESSSDCTVGVPGELLGFEKTYRPWGHLPWRRVIQPSAELAVE